MADSVKIRITGDDSDFNKTLSGIGQKAGSVFKGLMASQIVTKGISLLTSSLKSAITTGMQFEAAMSQVAAISGATGAELELLTDTAKRYGETTMFSASQAAEALNYMALAGWDAQQSVDALGGVLDLAAASGMDLGRASDAVTDYLSAFSMEASQAGYMADLMAYAQSKSNTTASMLADAYGNCATSMHAAGQDIETTTAMLMALANQGIKGSEAGTQMAAVMRDLTSKMEGGKIMIGKTAVQVTDATGNFRDLNDIIMDVGKATEGMGTAEQSAAIMTTFTARSVKAIQTLLNEGMDSVNEYETALRGSAGTAAEQAETMMDNLQGDIQIMQSAIEGLQITASESTNGLARTAVQEVTGIVDAINRAGKTGGLGGMADAVVAQIPQLLPKVTKAAQSLLAGLGKRLPSLMKGLISSVPDLLGGASELAPVLVESLTDAAGAAVGGLIGNLPDIVGRLAQGTVQTLASALSGSGNILFSALDSMYRLATGQVGKAFNIDQALDNILQRGKGGEHIVTLNATVDATVETTEAEAKIAEAIENIKGAFQAEGQEIDTDGIVDMIHQSDEEIIAACKNLGMSEEGAREVVEQVRALEQSVREAIAGLNLGDGMTEKVQQLVLDAGTTKAQLIAALKEMGLTPTDVAEVVAFYEQISGNLSAGVPSLFDGLAEALTDGKKDSPEVVSKLHDQIQGWFDDAVADVDAWAELEISKLDPTEAGYDEAIADIQAKAGELKDQLVSVKNSADEWVDANAGAVKGTVSSHIGELKSIRGEAEQLAKDIDDMTQDARGKVKSVGENAFRTVKIGGKVDAGTIDLAFTWSYNGHAEVMADLQEKHDQAIQELQSQNLSKETYDLEAGKIETQFELDKQQAEAAYIAQLRQMFSGLAQSTLPADVQESFSGALEKIDLMNPIKEWMENGFEGEPPELPPDLLQQMFPYANPENLDQMWQTVQESGQYGQVSDQINQWVRTMEQDAATALEGVEMSDLGTVLSDAITTGMFSGTSLEGLSASELLTQLFGNSLDGLASEAASMAEPAGASIPEGVASGIESNTEQAHSAASTSGARTIDALNTAIGHHSPSSYGIEAGASIPEGVAVGIEQGVGAATAAATGAGAQVVAGMAQGILSGRSQVVTAAITVATAAAEAIRAALQIHSPSRVTRLFGEQVDMGFIEGIRDKLPEIQRTVASAFAIEPGVGRFELALASERSGDQRLSALSESFGRMASQLQEIRAAIPSGDRPVVLDGRRLVGGIRDEMNRQLGQTATWREGGHA